MHKSCIIPAPRHGSLPKSMHYKNYASSLYALHGGHLTVQWCRAVSCSLTCPVAVQFWFGDSLSQNIRCLIDIRLPLSVARPLSRNVAAQKKFWTLSTILLQLVWLSMGQRASRESLYCRLTLYIVPKHGHGALTPRPSRAFAFQIGQVGLPIASLRLQSPRHSLCMKIITCSSQNDMKTIKNTNIYRAWTIGWSKAKNQ